MGSDEEMYAFRCPACDESMEVNGAMKAKLLEKGCVVCGADVTPAAFSTLADSS